MAILFNSSIDLAARSLELIRLSIADSYFWIVFHRMTFALPLAVDTEAPAPPIDSIEKTVVR